MRTYSSGSLASTHQHGFHLGRRNKENFTQRARPAALKLLSALVKDSGHVKMAAFEQLVEFFQLLTICFIGPWGPLGEKTFHVILWSQIETVFLEFHVPALGVAVCFHII